MVVVGDLSGRVRRGAGGRPFSLAVWALLLICLLLSVACADGTRDPAEGGGEAPDRLVGAWRAEFTPANAHAPFTLRVKPQGGELSAVIERSGEEIPVSSIVRRDLVVTIRLARPETEIFAKMAPNGGSMSGFWRVDGPGGNSELPFKAWRMDPGEGG